MEITKKVERAIKEYALLEEGERVVVAVSGGADSVCLLHILCKLSSKFSLTLCVAHFNHLLRGKEAAEDEKFVRNVARELKLPFFVQRVWIKGVAKGINASLQEAARVWRYNFLDEVAAQFCARKIALGHTLTDVAETVLMHIIKGCGIGGLAGLLPKRELTFASLIRPLIYLSSSQIREYMKEEGIPYREDSSNIKPLYLRNKIRHRLLPLLKECNPGVEHSLFKLSRLAAECKAFIQESARKAFSKTILSWDEEELHLDAERLKALPPALLSETVKGLLLTFTKRQVKEAHVLSIIKLLESSGSAQIHLPQDIKVLKEYGKIKIWRGKKYPGYREYKVQVKIPGEVVVEGVGRVNVYVAPSPKREEDKYFALFDIEKVKPPLYLRSRERGDYFYPSKFWGKKSLKKFFIDKKIPLQERDTIPLLVDAEKILWVIGYRKDRRAAPDEGTKNFLCAEFSPLR